MIEDLGGIGMHTFSAQVMKVRSLDFAYRL